MMMFADAEEKVEDPAGLDAAVGGDTHRDTHHLEMVSGAGVLISRITIDNDADGYAEALAWIADHTPGPRVLIGLEGTRSHGVGLCRALLLTGSDEDRDLSRGAMSQAHLCTIARRRVRKGETTEQRVRREEATRVAQAILQLIDELTANKKELAALVEEFVPGLLDTVGVGPVSGAQAIVSFSHVGRCRNEAAFAALAGASPVPASSGRTHRHRLNRGGDRQLNRALHDIAKTWWRHCERTKAHIARRRAEQMPDREIRRCLKRYIARELFRALTAAGVDNT